MLKVISELLWFKITSLSDWFKVLAPLFQQIRSETKTNRASRVHIFSPFVSATCNYFEFWLVYWIVSAFLIGQSNYFGFGLTALDWNSLYPQTYHIWLFLNFKKPSAQRILSFQISGEKNAAKNIKTECMKKFIILPHLHELTRSSLSFAKQGEEKIPTSYFIAYYSVLSLRPRPHVTGDFLIRNLFFSDFASVHT